MRVFLGGWSGTGKTTVGNYLRSHGWVHVDVEDMFHTSPRSFGTFIRNPAVWLSDRTYPTDDVVITWGYGREGKPTVGRILDIGFKPVWLTGDLKHSLANRARRGDKIQHRPDLERLQEVERLKAGYNWTDIGVFHPDGTMLATKEVADMVCDAE
jgi:hypothetical protein